MKKKGFTYIEIMIAISLFILIFTFIIKLNSKSSKLMRDTSNQTQLIYIAQMELEKYKSSPIDFKGFKNITFNSNIVRYYIVISSTTIASSPNLKEVTIQVSKNKQATNTATLQCHIITN